jgi:hypothetical protein
MLWLSRRLCAKALCVGFATLRCVSEKQSMIFIFSQFLFIYFSLRAFLRTGSVQSQGSSLFGDLSK